MIVTPLRSANAGRPAAPSDARSYVHSVAPVSSATNTGVAAAAAANALVTRNASAAVAPTAAAYRVALATTLRWLCTTALGTPDVPEVYDTETGAAGSIVGRVPCSRERVTTSSRTTGVASGATTCAVAASARSVSTGPPPCRRTASARNSDGARGSSTRNARPDFATPSIATTEWVPWATSTTTGSGPTGASSSAMATPSDAASSAA